MNERKVFDMNNSAVKVITGGSCRFSYCSVWEPKSINGGEPRYSVSVLVPKTDKETVMKIREAIQQAYKDGESKLKGKGSLPPLSALKTPLRDGDTERPWTVGDGSFRSQFPVDRFLQPCKADQHPGNPDDQENHPDAGSFSGPEESGQRLLCRGIRHHKRFKYRIRQQAAQQECRRNHEILQGALCGEHPPLHLQRNSLPHQGFLIHIHDGRHQIASERRINLLLRRSTVGIAVQRFSGYNGIRKGVVPILSSPENRMFRKESWK